MLPGRLIVAVVIGMVLALPGVADAQAPSEFTVLSESAVFDPVTGQVTFTLVFNRRPDFQTEDSVGRRADSFQYYIVGDPTLPYPANYDAIIRGDEIDVTSGLLPIRSSVPPATDPAAGGWGHVRAVVPFSLNENVLTFSTSLALISDHSVDGHFSYELLLTQYGGFTQFVQSESVVRPSSPTSKEQCKHGGWHAFGFENEGECIAFVTHAHDCRILEQHGDHPHFCPPRPPAPPHE
jgi:hypothetical protein